VQHVATGTATADSDSLCNSEDNVLSSGSETPSTLATIVVSTPVTDETTIMPKNTENAKIEGKTENAKSSENEEEDDPKKRRGWPSRPPFSNQSDRGGGSTKSQNEERIYWNEMTWSQKLAWRKAFVREYLAETKSCLPHVRKLFLMIYRISPWRAIVVFALNVVGGLLPALTLQTRGNFILMVCPRFNFILIVVTTRFGKTNFE